MVGAIFAGTVLIASTGIGRVRTWSFRLFGLRNSVDGLVVWKMLIHYSKVERGRIGKLRFCKIGYEACLAANLDLTYRHSNKFFPDTEEAAQRKDECC